MVKGAQQREWPRHLSTHTHWTLPTTMSVLETPFDIHVSSVYQTHTCMQAPVSTLCISAKKTHNKGSRTQPIMSTLMPRSGSRTQPIMSTLMPRSGIPVICSRATLSCDSSYYFLFFRFFSQQVRRNKNKNKIHSDHFPIELKSKETQLCFLRF